MDYICFTDQLDVAVIQMDHMHKRRGGIKDAQIRDGLHVLGEAPAGEARVNLVLAILRATDPCVQWTR